MRWLMSEDDAGERLDKYLADYYSEARNQTARWIRDGLVQVDGRPATKPSHRLEGREWIECEPPERNAAAAMTAEDGPLDIVLEDDHLAIVNKPAGMVVHPGAGRETGTLAHRILHRYPETGTIGGPGRPGIVHRLDRGTTGCLIVARTGAAYAGLSAAFAERRVQKTYLALVYGVPRPPEATVDAPIGRHRTRRKEMTVVVDGRGDGRPSVTHYRTLASADGVSLLEIDLETGRTHQIRVHLKHARHPLVGDPVYGEARWKELAKSRQASLRRFERPALHAWRIALRHPVTGEPIGAQAPPPADLTELWRALANSELGASLAESSPG